MRLVIDNDQNLDANNVYLPETGGGGTPATGGAITINSVTVNDDATASTETTGVLDASDGGQIGATSGTFGSPYNGYFNLLVNNVSIVTTPNTAYNTVEEVLAAIDTLMTGNATYTFSYSGDLWSLTTIANRNTGHTVEIVADSQDILSTGTFTGGGNPSTITLEFDAGVTVSLSGLAGAEITSSDTPTTIAEKLRNKLNALSQFTPDGVVATSGTLTFETKIGTDEFNNVDIFITEEGGGSITTSGMTPLSGGIDDVASITPTLASINKSRKSYFDGTKAYIKGFGGFILIDETPVSQDNQTDFFALARNKITVDANNGIGFTHRIESIASESFYFVNAFRINGSNQISNTLSEHLWLRITRNASDNLEIDLCTLTGKTTANGWEFSVAQNLVTNADGLAYVADRYLRWVYPQSGATITQFITLSDLSTVTDYVNVTGTPLTALNTLLDGNTFTLPHVAGNVGSDAILTVIRADGE